MASYIGKVIRILDEFTLIVDSGEFSVSVGDTVQVYEDTEPIKNLDGTNLGKFVFIKDELKVVQVEDLYCICKKNKTVTKTTSMALALSPLLEHTHTEKVPLPVDPTDFEPIPTISKTIHVGDNVRKL